MRAVAGFVVVNAWLVAVGLGLLRAVGLRGPEGPRSWLLWSGPALVLGVASVIPVLVLCLVVGIAVTPLTVLVAGIGLLAGAAGWDRRVRGTRGGAPTRASWLERAVAFAATLYAAVGVFAFAQAPTRGDDARIWSLRGLTLIDFHRLAAAMFLNPGQSGGHSVYPLLQPLLETITSEAMGSPQLRIYHSEVWLMVISTIWFGALLLVARASDSEARRPLWLAPIALVALTPIVIVNVYVGDADMTATMLLAVGMLACALWLETGEGGLLAVGALLLAAAANTKDEEFLCAIPVLLILGAAILLERRRPPANRPAGRGRAWLAAVALYAVVVLPWRLWLSAHQLSDAVQPPLPRALNPVWLVRQHRLHLVLTAMLDQTLRQWGWLAAIFLVTVLACLLTRTAVRVAAFYLVVVAVIVAVLIWTYVGTPLSLAFLIPTSMDRTVGVFMAPAGLATAHLLTRLLASESPVSGSAWWRSSRTASPR